MTALALGPSGPTANDRLKGGFESRLALSFVAATVLHVLIFALWPTMETDALGTLADVPPDVIRLDEVDVPEQPEPLVRPADPVISADVDPTATIPDVGWSEVAELPPPPPVADEGTRRDALPFTPYTVGPALLNQAEVARALEREYPAILREAGITGTVQLLVHIDASGAVLESRLGTSSGVAGLDDAALRVADVFRFRGALNRDTPVPVWVRMPVTFTLR